MPHITLLYPFHPKETFSELEKPLSDICSSIGQFEITLDQFRYFDHGQNFTIWLEPKPQDGVKRLHQALLNVFPELDDTSLFSNGFTPHLSLGQRAYKNEVDELIRNIQSNWQPLTFKAEQISVIWRNERFPDDVFRLHKNFSLKS